MESLKSFRNWMFIVIAVLFIFSFSIHKEGHKSDIHLLPQQLQTGDIILRNSNGMLASFFRNMSKQDKRYSHAGFIVVGNKTWVCHYIDNENGNGLIAEELKDFVNEHKCNAYGVYRFPLTEAERGKLDYIISNDIQHPVAFDEKFDLQTDDKLYCTEWISKSLWNAAHIKIPVTASEMMEYIALDNLYINSGSRMIAVDQYQNKNIVNK